MVRLARMMRMIAALDAAYGIATDDGIPWTLPTDQRFFVDTTAEGIILMGHTTYLEFDAPMHGRTNYVATTGVRELRDGFIPVGDVPQFLAEHADARVNNIGGGGLFASTLGFADELVLTRIDGEFACTKFFPAFEDGFELSTESDPVWENDLTFTFQTWNRRPEP